MTASDADLSWAVFKFLSIIASTFILLLVLAWMLVKRWPSK